MRHRIAAAMVAVVAIAMLGLTATPASAATDGDWTLYPPIVSTYQAQTLQPVNNNGSSNYAASTTDSIPLRFTLFRKTQTPVRFQSIFSDNPGNTADDFSFLSFSPSAPMTFADITNLSAVFSYTQGQSNAGSLRWEIDTPLGNLQIYYGDPPAWTGTGGTGVNMIGLPDLRYDTSQFLGGQFFDTYADALTLMGNLPIDDAALVLDSGWTANGDQRVFLTSATVNDNTWQKGKFHVTAPMPGPATFQITKLDSTPRKQTVNETETVPTTDTSGVYRVVEDGTVSPYPFYEYDISVPSLTGRGTYKMTITLGTQQIGSAKFDLI
jgi:hypothetical protein